MIYKLRKRANELNLDEEAFLVLIQDKKFYLKILQTVKNEGHREQN